MSRLAYDQRVTKSAFIQKLCNDFGVENLIQSAYQEVIDGAIVKMTLFYVNDTKHIATWRGGCGWIFASAYNTVTA